MVALDEIAVNRRDIVRTRNMVIMKVQRLRISLVIAEMLSECITNPHGNSAVHLPRRSLRKDDSASVVGGPYSQHPCSSTLQIYFNLGNLRPKGIAVIRYACPGIKVPSKNRHLPFPLDVKGKPHLARQAGYFIKLQRFFVG